MLTKKCQIPFRTRTSSWKPSARTPLPKQLPLVRSTLWEDSHVLAESQRMGSNYYLFVSLRNSKPFIETTGTEMIPLKRAIGKMSVIFQAAFGSFHYTEVLVENIASFSFQLFPSGNFTTKRAEEVDIYAKVQRNFYMLSQGQFGDAALPYKAMRKFQEYLPLMMGPFPISDRDRRTPRIEAQWTRSGEAASSSLKALLHSWQEAGLRVKHIPSLSLQRTPLMPMLVKKTEKCAFCMLEVIKRQRLIEGRFMHILYNHLPYVRRLGEETSHFMLVTKHHLENTSGASDEELMEEHEMLVRIKNIMSKARPEFAHRIWKQQGIKAGQTVPHHHTHFLVYQNRQLPEYLEQLAMEIAGMQMTPVSQKSPQFVTEY